MRVRAHRHLLIPEMEGAAARRYARQRGTPGQIAEFRREAIRLTTDLAEGARVLEIAPGPGYLAVEMARTGRASVTGIDVSGTMVAIAAESARRAGVSLDLVRGDAARMPFPERSFDLVVCQAAFKNFRRPLAALDEIHRVLRPGGAAVIQDMRHEASRADIAREVHAMDLRGAGAWITRLVMVGLRRRAYSVEGFRSLVAGSAFATCEIGTTGIGFEVRLTRADGAPSASTRDGA